MMRRIQFLLLISFLNFITITIVHGMTHSGGMTQANGAQKRAIAELLEAWDSDSVERGGKSKMFRRRDRAFRQYDKEGNYRLDDEGPTSKNNQLFRIQSGQKTFSDVEIQPKINFGRERIVNTFMKSVEQCKPQTLCSSSKPTTPNKKDKSKSKNKQKENKKPPGSPTAGKGKASSGGSGGRKGNKNSRNG